MEYMDNHDDDDDDKATNNENQRNDVKQLERFLVAVDEDFGNL
jgi:hypothetical protein